MLRASFCLAVYLAAQSIIFAAEVVPSKPQLAPPAKAPTAQPSHTATQAVVQLRADKPASYPTTPYPAVAVAATQSTPQPPAAVVGRKQLEASLDKPANLDYGDRKTVTVKEVLDDLHAQHHLSIRFDMPTLSSLLGISPMGGAEHSLENAPLPEPPVPSLDGVTPSEKAPTADSTASLCDPAPLEVVPQPNPKEKAPIADAETAQDSPAAVLDMLMKAEVNIEHVDVKNVSIATVLRHTCDALPIASGLDDGTGGIPIKITNASIIDYVVEDDGLLITTRMAAMTVKETRVYSLKKLKGISPDELSKVIRQSIRPWSWRSQINDLGEQLKAGMPSQLPAEMTSSIMNTAVQLMSGASSIMGESECTECIMPVPMATMPPPVTTYMPATSGPTPSGPVANGPVPGSTAPSNTSPNNTIPPALPVPVYDPTLYPPPLPTNATLNVVPSGTAMPVTGLPAHTLPAMAAPMATPTLTALPGHVTMPATMAHPTITISASSNPVPPVIPPSAYVPPPSSPPHYGTPLNAGPVAVMPNLAAPSTAAPNAAAQSSEASAATIGINALVNALVTFAHASLSAMEMVHYAEPPTGTIQTLPGKLIITQSQSAHREIADLLKQLEEE